MNKTWLNNKKVDQKYQIWLNNKLSWFMDKTVVLAANISEMSCQVHLFFFSILPCYGIVWI